MNFAKRPDKFQSSDPLKTRIFQFAAVGAAVGTFFFGLIGLLVSAASAGSQAWPYVSVLGITGFILAAVFSGFLALYTRDIKLRIGRGA